MQHWDDGALAAHLDGEAAGRLDGWTAGSQEHLAGCAECQARLEALRMTRERAKAILRSGTPSGAQPSFQDVLKRRAAKADARKLSSMRPLAWAATVVLALGVGWYAREMTVQPRSQLQSADERMSGSADVTRPMVADSAPRLAARQTPVMRAPLEQAAGLRDAGTAGAGGEVSAKAKETANVIAERKDEANAPAAQPSSRPAAPLDDQLKKLAPRDTQKLALDAVVVTAANEPVAQTRAAESERASVNRRARQAPAAAAPAPAPAVARGFADAPSPASPLLRSSVAAASSVLGRPPLTVPGLEIIAVQTGPNSVRVTQRMATGILEMIQQRPGAREESGPSASQAVTGPGIGALVEGIQLRLWGPVSYDSLRALVGKLR